MALTLRHATAAQLAAAFRERYKAATGIEAGRLANWLLSRIADGTFTETQARNAFGLTAAQWNTLKTNRLEPQQARYLTVIADNGA